MPLLNGQRIVVTGASRGLGRAMAVALAAEGATVIVTGRDLAALAMTKAAVTEIGGACETHALDITDANDVDDFAEKIWTNGPVDTVFANAGISLTKPATDTTDADMRRIVEANVLGSFATLRAFGARMLVRGSGKLIATSSDIGIRGSAGWVAYAASKGALNAMVKTLAWEWAPGLTVNAIAPGAFATDINAHLLAVPEVMQAISAETPLGRVGQADEIGPLAVFMAGSGSDFMTGEIISLDGGIKKS
ncbi:SDR family oxidoreductase [Pseudooceanicola sediminis]|uniref:SDR family oxidoreductase n=1 Tax=Pseudooceanicola sediminis TaxID=2211117 RepID=A0A399IXX3_9RHOB|nr:SDR family NAD(P)-dependent oxidoreductase [Pseudooceanicola sediminis]RII37871.1 SDR family oxidoreductase [Pseudooceanicola sediminis]|tara:strand:+ start:51869 stop:52615 length:747 start_codon:yes stop_codon:yes gene_type:complete